MEALIVVVLVVCTSLAGAILQPPPYMKLCSRSDPNFKKCCLESAKIAIPQLIKGDRKYKFPSMDPMRISEIKVSQGPSQAGLKLAMQNVEMHGMKDNTPLSVDFDFTKGYLKNTLAVPRLEILAKYEVTGKILLLPFNGKGDLNITMVNNNISFFSDFHVENNRMRLTNSGAKLDPSKAYIQLTNLFGGDKLLGKQMNEFINENWREVFAELAPTIEQAFGDVINIVFNNFSDLLPLDVMFPE